MLAKRIFDVCLSLAVLILLLPLLAIISISLLFTGEGYVFYFQERIGHHRTCFRIWKFATMLKDSPNLPGGIITTKNDPRLTPMGGFLRKSKINELPQIINILRGDMSIVGPRPVMRKSFEQYPPEVQAVIYKMRPGLTGIGSIVFRDEEELITRVKNEGGSVWNFYREKIYPHKGELEEWYQKHQSFWLDIGIIFLTAWVVFFPKSEIYYRWFTDLPRREF